MSQPTTHDDLMAAQAGDAAALGRLLSAHKNGVYRYGLQVCRTTENAEDALQETLWAATRAIKSFRGTASSFLSWLFTIIRRECHRLLDRRREVLLPPGIFDGFVAAEPAPDDALAHDESAAMLANALAGLHPLHREIIILRDIEQLSAPEAASRLHISIPALKSRLHRARARLRERMLAQVGELDRR